MKNLILKKNEDRRINAGHLWVFSNEVDTAKTPLKNFTPGEFVNLQNSRGQDLGTVYVNPASLIAARLFSSTVNTPLAFDLLHRRITSALTLRAALFDQPFYRLVHAEGDILPGLVIDRYGNDFVIQISTAGMEGLKDVLCEVMEDIFPGLNIIFRGDTQSRALENLPSEITFFKGKGAKDLPEKFELAENGLTYTVFSQLGQKTGWFYDQRCNRKAALELAQALLKTKKDVKVLDAFCYAGGFGVAAAAGGASEITFLDSSQPALDLAGENMLKNNFAHKPATTSVQGDALTCLEEMKAAGKSFDLVCLDPPAFIKRKKDEEAGLAAYYRANELALDLVEPGGFFITSSCSQHLERENLRRILVRIGARRRLNIQIIGEGRQGPDHPVNPAMPETEYLKTFFIRLV